MGIAQRLRAIDERLSRAAVEQMKANGIGWPNPGWAPPPGHVGVTAAGVSLNEDRANTVPAWFAGIRNISEDVAVAPLHVYRRNGRNADKATDLPVYRMLHDAPNPEMTSFTFRSVLQSHAMAWGNGYAEKELNGSGRTIALWPLRPDRMEVVWEGGTRVYYYRPTALSAPIRMEASRVYHLPGMGFDGLQGYSLLRLARETLGSSIALREYGSRVLANDARPSIALTHPGALSETARTNIRDSWNATYGGFTNAGRTAVLEEGITVKEMGFPPEDIQFLESQQWQVSEVARWLRIAPHKIGDLSRATFSNIEEQNIDHVTSTLRAWFVRWEQQLNKDVIADPVLYCEHNVDAQLRGKTLERAQANVLKINTGAMTPNEWRAQDNENPLAWGDERVNTPNNTAADAAATMAGKSAPWVINNHPPQVKVDAHIDSVALSDAALEQSTAAVKAAVGDGFESVGTLLGSGLGAIATTVESGTAAVRSDITATTEALSGTLAEAARPKAITRDIIHDPDTGLVSGYVERQGDAVKRVTVERGSDRRIIATREEPIGGASPE